PAAFCCATRVTRAYSRLLTLTPWHDALLLGSTDVECDPAELNCPKPTVEEVEYLLAALAAAAPNWTPRVLAAWSGIRPLLGHSGDRTADLSREDRLLDAAPGVVAIAGGKLTTFRRLAQRTLDRVDELSGHSGPAEPFPHLQPLPTGLHELARDGLVSTLDEVMTQRLPLSLLHPDAAAGRAPGIASEIAPIMRWSTEACEQQVASYRAGLDRFRDPRRA
ncbi:MAG TPA: FAD-dependent oxidoreductase, partial [Roseiflexaceae bacterium]